MTEKKGKKRGGGRREKGAGVRAVLLMGTLMGLRYIARARAVLSLSTSLYLPLVYPTYRPHIADYIRQKQKELAHETCTSTAVD